jgi:hypothetical protein
MGPVLKKWSPALLEASELPEPNATLYTMLSEEPVSHTHKMVEFLGGDESGAFPVEYA